MLERPLSERIQIGSLSLERVLAYSSERALSAPVREAFTELATLKREVVQHERRTAQVEESIQRLVSDQGRVRDNLARVPRDSDLYRRYIKKLDSQETELERLRAARVKAEAARRRATDRLATYIAELEV